MAYCTKCLNLYPLCVCGKTYVVSQNGPTLADLVTHDQELEKWRIEAYASLEADHARAMTQHQIAIHRAQLQASLAVPTTMTLPVPNRELPRWVKWDPKVPDTMGWRAWRWNRKYLSSPHYPTLWKTDRLDAKRWDDEEAVRGFTGIHARRVPKLWKLIGWPDGDSSSDLEDDPFIVTGLVERFGKFVLGENGWRAEQVVIRELMAPDTRIGLKLEQRYPNVIVHYPDQEEEKSWTSVKSSKLGKGKRRRLPNRSTRSTAPRVNQPIRRGKSQAQQILQIFQLLKKYRPEDK